tara:strand:+ start:50146 stop:50478 length:333 start_codon:yes stop_codon:yes gene_type:complete
MFNFSLVDFQCGYYSSEIVELVSIDILQKIRSVITLSTATGTRTLGYGKINSPEYSKVIPVTSKRHIATPITAIMHRAQAIITLVFSVTKILSMLFFPIFIERDQKQKSM